MDEFINKLIAFREEKRMLESKLKEAKAECENLKNVAYYNEEKYIECNREKQTLARKYRLLNSENLQLLGKYKAIEEKNKTIENELATLSFENKKMKEENSNLRKDSIKRLLSHSEIDVKTKAVRELVEQLIIYAERENKSTAREIRIALEKKMANGFIPSEILTPEYKQRLDNLGRDNQAIVYNTNYNYSAGSTHHDNRRTLNIERKENDGKFIDKL